MLSSGFDELGAHGIVHELAAFHAAMPKVRRFALITLALAGLCSAGFSQSAGAPQRLRIEYLENPLGLDETKPRFTWELDDARRSAKQTAYEIVVATDVGTLDLDTRVPGMTGNPNTTVISDAIVWRSEIGRAHV